MLGIKYYITIEEQARNIVHAHIFLWIENLPNMNDHSPPKRRKVSENVSISPKKLATKRAVEHYFAALGDGTVGIDLAVCPDRPKFTEAYSLPAKKAIDEKDRNNSVLAEEGYFLTVGLVAHTEVNETNDEPIRNTRGYLMKALAVQSDEVMTSAVRKMKLNVLTSVSLICTTFQISDMSQFL